MRIIIGGGGTGGHIYPGLALARYISKVNPGSRILFLGTEKGIESRSVPAAGFSFKTLPALGLQRNLSGLVIFAKALFSGTKKASAELLEFSPAVVLGMGGYVSAPVVLAALLKRKTVILHEQNVKPGLVTRLFAPFVSLVCISFAETGEYLSRFSRVEYTGNPRASEVQTFSREEGCVHFGLEPNRKTILIYGGSRGAQRLNEIVVSILQDEAFCSGKNFIYITGEIYFEEVMQALKEIPDNIKVFPYLENMPLALASADLAVTRSGATTLAELTASGLPAILIPSPNVVANHQYFNALMLKSHGAAELIEEKDLSVDSLGRAVNLAISDSEVLKRMKEKSLPLGKPGAADRVYRLIMEVAQ